MELPPTILLVDKPKGMSSFDVIRRLRVKLGIRKMGHAGTLDPLATGLMIIARNEGTKLLTNYLKLDKEYVAEVRIGERRSTGDMEGDILEERVVTSLDTEEVQKVIASLVGTVTLPVSAYSAIKRDGVPMYKHARRFAARGETLDESELPVRDMVVKEAELLNMKCENERCVLTVLFFVGSGTYIRSLGEELGRRLGYPATLQNLRRTKIGEFDIKDALTLD